MYYGSYTMDLMTQSMSCGSYSMEHMTYPWGKQPFVWVVFHCLRNLSRLHGLVYDRTSRNCKRSVLSILTFKYEILFPFCKTELFRRVSSQYLMIYEMISGSICNRCLSVIFNVFINIPIWSHVSWFQLIATEATMQLIHRASNRWRWKMILATLVVILNFHLCQGKTCILFCILEELPVWL